jgi:hypothetical protein
MAPRAARETSSALAAPRPDECQGGGALLDVLASEPPAPAAANGRDPAMSRKSGDVLRTAPQDQTGGNRREPDVAILRWTLWDGFAHRTVLPAGASLVPRAPPRLYGLEVQARSSATSRTVSDLDEVLLDRARRAADKLGSLGVRDPLGHGSANAPLRSRRYVSRGRSRRGSPAGRSQARQGRRWSRATCPCHHLPDANWPRCPRC